MPQAERGTDCCNVFAHSRRQRILRLLFERPEIGRSFSDMQQATGYSTGPLLNHLRRMERAGMIMRDRAGHTMAGPMGVMPDVTLAAKSSAQPARARRVA